MSVLEYTSLSTTLETSLTQDIHTKSVIGKFLMRNCVRMKNGYVGLDEITFKALMSDLYCSREYSLYCMKEFHA